VIYKKITRKSRAKNKESKEILSVEWQGNKQAAAKVTVVTSSYLKSCEILKW
jgi:hypothetical protein